MPKGRSQNSISYMMTVLLTGKARNNNFLYGATAVFTVPFAVLGILSVILGPLGMLSVSWIHLAVLCLSWISAVLCLMFSSLLKDTGRKRYAFATMIAAIVSIALFVVSIGVNLGEPMMGEGGLIYLYILAGIGVLPSAGMLMFGTSHLLCKGALDPDVGVNYESLENAQNVQQQRNNSAVCAVASGNDNKGSPKPVINKEESDRSQQHTNIM